MTTEYDDRSERPSRPIVPFQRPEPPVAEEILVYYRESEKSGWYANRGPCQQLLAERVGSALGGVAAVPVASGTSGLMVALRAAAGPGDGRFVVAPSFTCPAVACAISWAGFRPLLADVDVTSWQLDPASLEAALVVGGERVAAVLACSTFGTAAPTPMRKAWRELVAAAGVPLLVDSAAGFGTVDDEGLLLGQGPEPQVFSFHATKPSAVGEGGVITASDPDFADRCRRLSNYGFAQGAAVTGAPGLNAKMSELHAAAALAMLDGLAAAIERRQKYAQRLQTLLADLHVRFQQGVEQSTWPSFQLLLPTLSVRARALAAAEALSVEVRTLWDPPLHRQPAFAGCVRAGDLNGTEELAARVLSLPMATRLSDDEISRIAEVARTACG